MKFLSDIVNMEWIGWIALIVIIAVFYPHIRRMAGWLLMKLYAFFISGKDHVTPI
jgi:hypothetical protein